MLNDIYKMTFIVNIRREQTLHNLFSGSVLVKAICPFLYVGYVMKLLIGS